MRSKLDFLCIFVVVTIFLIKSVLSIISHSCPPPSLFTRIASKECIETSNYHCLYNSWLKLYESHCFEPETFPSGSYVLYEGGLNSKACKDNRYQPKYYFSNQYNSLCLYIKSKCSDKGQVVHDNSFTEKDTTCRCDYRKGYDFVIRPRNRCFCTPSEEDCSCYKKQCPENTTLTADYKCRGNGGLITCPAITERKDEQKHQAIITRVTGSSVKTVTYKSGMYKWHLRGIVAMVILLIIGCTIVIQSQNNTEEVKFLELPSNIERINTRKSPELDGCTNNYCTEDEPIIFRNGYLKSLDALRNHRLIVIKGRYGTGKSVMADQITQKFPDYKKLLLKKEDLIPNYDVTPEEHNRIIIFDEICDINEDVEERSKKIQAIESFFNQRSTLVIVTVGEFNNVFVESLRKISLVGDDNLIDLDTEFALSEKEKLRMLNHHLKEFTSRKDSIMVASLLSEYVKKEIVSTDTYYGFPLLCSTFLSEIDNLQLGAKYFRQPPQELIDEIEKIRLDATSKDESSKIQYSILIYILLSNGGFANINDIQYSLIYESTQYYFGHGFIEKDLIRYLNKKDIPLQRFLQYMGDGKYTMHPTVYQTVLLSFAKTPMQFKKAVKICKFEHMLDLCRMPNCEILPNEIVLLCPKEYVQSLARRMVIVSFLDQPSACMVCRYIVKMQYDYLSQQYFSFLEQEFSKNISEKRVRLMLIIFKELVLNKKGRHAKYSSFLATWSTLACTKYEKLLLVPDMMKPPEFVTEKAFLIKVLCSVVDEYKNNMLTYFILWWKNDSEHPFVMHVSNLFSQSPTTSLPTDLLKKNTDQVSPASFAAYFGRHQCLQKLLQLEELVAKEQISTEAAFKTLMNETEHLIHLVKKGEKKILVDVIKYNTDLCPKVERPSADDFENTFIVLEDFRTRLDEE